MRLSQLAREHNVTFERSQAKTETVKESDLDRMGVSYDLAGNWDDIRQFIYAIETGGEFVVIDNVLLAEGAGGGAPLSLTLEVSTYYRTGAHDR